MSSKSSTKSTPTERNDGYVALSRSIAQIVLRLKAVEDFVQATSLACPKSAIEETFPKRADVQLSEVADVTADDRAQSEMLQSMFASEHGKLTQFAVGTWPSEKFIAGSCCVHGCEVNSSSEPLEVVRATVIPAFIKSNIPFSCVTVDSGETVPIQKIQTIVNSCSSHLILMTPNLSNYREMILFSYLLGRGNSNLHLVKFDYLPYSFPNAEKVVNVLGPNLRFTHRERTAGKCVRAVYTVSFL